MLTFAAVVLLGAAPPSVVDAYRMLAKAGKVEAVLTEKAGRLEYVPPTEELQFPKAPPLVDVPNGYLRYGYSTGPGTLDLELALYLAGARRFVLLSEHVEGIESSSETVTAWELQGGALTDVTREVGELARVKWTDFLDEKLPEQARAEAEEVRPATLLEVTLPRTGTTVLVRLKVLHEPGTGVDQSYGPRAEALAAKYQRFEVLELTWSTKDAKFSRGAKRPVSAAAKKAK